MGRRLAVLIASAICTVTMLIVGILGLVPHSQPLQNFLIFVACVWSFGSNALGGLGWAFVGEIAAQRLRARTAGLAGAMSVVFGLTFNTSVPAMCKSRSLLVSLFTKRLTLSCLISGYRRCQLGLQDRLVVLRHRSRRNWSGLALCSRAFSTKCGRA